MIIFPVPTKDSPSEPIEVRVVKPVSYEDTIVVPVCFPVYSKQDGVYRVWCSDGCMYTVTPPVNKHFTTYRHASMSKIVIETDLLRTHTWGTNESMYPISYLGQGEHASNAEEFKTAWTNTLTGLLSISDEIQEHREVARHTSADKDSLTEALSTQDAA